MLNETSTSFDIPAPSRLKLWFSATRPRTLSISLIPLLVGTALASHHVQHLNWIVVISTFLCVPWIQIGMHFVDDALDMQKGRKIEKQMIWKKVNILPSHLLIAGFFCLGLTAFFGIPLMLTGGWPLIFLIAISIACGYLYTGGPYPISTLGISDLLILVFYGWVITAVPHYLQTGKIGISSLLAGTQLGCFAIVSHAINNLRDHKKDALTEKKTFVVRFGTTFARWEITLLSLFPFILGLLWIPLENRWMTLLPFLSLPLVLNNLKGIWQTEPSNVYNQFLAKSTLNQLIFGCLLIIGLSL